MDKKTFLAIFEPGEQDELGYTVTFPDLPGAITEGDDLEQARHNARECLELHLYGMERDGDTIPSPADSRSLIVPPGAFLVAIDAWMDMFREEMANKSVNKMVTIPRWLKDAGDSHQVNYSQVLQQALKEHLGVNTEH